MSALEAQFLDLDHEVGRHAPGDLVCPACLARDLKAKAQATFHRAAEIAEAHGATALAAVFREESRK